MTFNFNMPAVNRQVFVAGYFDKFKSGHMREALIQACQNISPVDLRRELAEYAPEKGLKRLMGTSIRDEDVFATPLLLRQSPGLLAYYRMLLGFSQKRFYASSIGLSRYKCLEERLVIPADLIDGLPSLCLALNERACELVLMSMSDKRIFLETMFDGFTPDSVSREELISILLDDLMVVARDNMSIEYLENGGDEEEALKSFNVEMRKNLEERIIA